MCVVCVCGWNLFVIWVYHNHSPLNLCFFTYETYIFKTFCFQNVPGISAKTMFETSSESQTGDSNLCKTFRIKVKNVKFKLCLLR